MADFDIRLDTLEQAVIEETAHGSGYLDRDQFKAKYGGLPDTGSSGNSSRVEQDRNRPAGPACNCPAGCP